jgi:hypothetical protein
MNLLLKNVDRVLLLWLCFQESRKLVECWEKLWSIQQLGARYGSENEFYVHSAQLRTETSQIFYPNN